MIIKPSKSVTDYGFYTAIVNHATEKKESRSSRPYSPEIRPRPGVRSPAYPQMWAPRLWPIRWKSSARADTCVWRCQNREKALRTKQADLFYSDSDWVLMFSFTALSFTLVSKTVKSESTCSTTADLHILYPKYHNLSYLKTSLLSCKGFASFLSLSFELVSFSKPKLTIPCKIEKC